MRKIFLPAALILLCSIPVHARYHHAKADRHAKHHKTAHGAGHAARPARHAMKKEPPLPKDWREAAIQQLGTGSILVQDAQGRTILSYEADTPHMPASTIKIATAAAALKMLEPNYHFPTDFFWTPDGTLTVKGYGDPTLISEELARAASNLKRSGVTRVTNIRLDASYFDPRIDIDVSGFNGRRNPFDADVGPLVVNFNTASVRVSGRGRRRLVESADPNTPLTPFVVERAASLPRGIHNMGMGRNSQELLRFTGEMIAAFLQQAGIPTSGDIVAGSAPAGVSPIYRHTSANSLTGIIIGMLEFSNNFTANQVFLATGAAGAGAPATVAKSVKVMSDFLRQAVGWRNFVIAEGSGLSRQNQVTAADMMKLLRYFKPYQSLLPVKEGVFQAKTGTLADVSSFAGFFQMPGGGEITFVIIATGLGASYVQKFRIAKTIYQGITGQSTP